MPDFDFTMNDKADVDVVRDKLQLSPLASKRPDGRFTMALF